MRSHRNAALAGMLIAGMAACAVPREGDVTDEPGQPEPEPLPERPTNLPGETNRQFAARMKARAQ